MGTSIMEQKTFLTVIDVFSKLGCAFDIHDKTVIQVIYFTYYGTSEKKIILDNSKEFDNNLEIIIKTV